MSVSIKRRSLTFGIAASLAATLLPARAQDVLGNTTGIKGAGSTFAYPVLSMWSRDYRTWLSKGGEFPAPNTGLEDPPTTSALEYESVGSLAGTLRVKEGAVDFGASDMPLASEELVAFGLGQFPIVMGGVAIVVNLPGIGAGELKLTGPLLADIFLGKISKWSDPALAAHNPSAKLPDAPIAVIHRSDGSGTTFNFTDYLSKVSPEWKLRAGTALLISWPVGTGAKGNEGAARAVQTMKNSIGYVEYAQASQLGLSTLQIQNRAGKFVKPEPASFQAAASSGDFAGSKDFYALLTDSPGKDAYPITATVFALLPKPGSPARTGATLDFFKWCLEHGSNTASRLGYVPLPPALVQRVTAYWKATFKSGS
jgi:phosphate transport system substrate-binding protein